MFPEARREIGSFITFTTSYSDYNNSLSLLHPLQTVLHYGDWKIAINFVERQYISLHPQVLLVSLYHVDLQQVNINIDSVEYKELKDTFIMSTWLQNTLALTLG